MTPIEKIMSFLDTQPDPWFELRYRDDRWVGAVGWSEVGHPQYPIIATDDTREDVLAALAERLPE
ncbi:hypothetical protein SEA_OBLADI_69 [Gordonia phage ObLaDi]|uniref:Uncharacterized protein n=1 Tax=Gordonia phage ObLaDi TaxID=2978487 RepID=A0A977PQ51_9CAUD|nr:hypothetical protein SEA_OBLADI_69 [Gordonia phage ObLaDi]